MKSIILLSVLVFGCSLAAQQTIEVVRLNLDWVNAKECGIEGCKPQSLVLKNGGSIMFGWRQSAELFEASPVLDGDSVKLTFKKLKEVGDDEYDTTSEGNHSLKLGEPSEITLEQFEFSITALKETVTIKK